MELSVLELIMFFLSYLRLALGWWPFRDKFIFIQLPLIVFLLIAMDNEAPNLDHSVLANYSPVNLQILLRTLWIHADG